ncbi:MAG TPA: hypothetical protein VN541_08925 [Tepidisphaeraceae bacterium]|nr:hypothetical protein [Tepidisphaeraceae bacterium]
MYEPAPVSPDPPAYQCSSCGQVVTAAPDGQNLLQCPNCGEQFFIETSPDPASQAVEESTPSVAPESEISELRIRNVMHARQALYRSRRWPIIATAACLMAAAKLIQIAIVALRHGQRFIPALDLFGAILALILGAHFVRQVILITRQIRAARQPTPSTPPDFSTLSDGSQHWKNLEKLSDSET